MKMQCLRLKRDKNERTRVLDLFSRLVDPYRVANFTPYSMMGGRDIDDPSWILDMGNDWFLHFSTRENEEDMFRITTRYKTNQEALENLCRYVAERFIGFKIIGE